MPCLACHEPLSADADPRRKTCSARCRSRLHKHRRAERLQRAQDLVQRQTAAIIAGDAEALARVVAEADRLFAATS
jgi:predicted nucleic acid-binding Zn ribbon protein